MRVVRRDGKDAVLYVTSAALRNVRFGMDDHLHDDVGLGERWDGLVPVECFGSDMDVVEGDVFPHQLDGRV